MVVILDGESKQVYAFSYDGISRLKGADYGSGATLTNNKKYDVSGITYDDNGNIETLSRRENGSLIDALSYAYNGNQLTGVEDTGSDRGFKDGTTAAIQYDYDDNGNMKQDLNKGISSIKYNVLNLPEKIVFANGKEIKYVYSASGEKLQNIVGGNTLTYCGVWGGNVRAVVDGNGAIKQKSNYYPFGMTFAQSSSSTNKYLYNGKEKQEETGWLDYGARMYASELGRWMCVDPLAEKYMSMSPYNYVANNPMLHIDPNGEEIWIYYKDQDGKDQKIQYTAGMKYVGDNEFVTACIESLNMMNSNENGAKVLSTLCSSDNAFNMTNTYAKNKKGENVQALSFEGAKGGGGEIHARELLTERSSEFTNVENIAHEMFHGYQHENGQGGRSSFNEVEAMVFGYSVAKEYVYAAGKVGGSCTPMGKDNTSYSQRYQEAFASLLYSTSFPRKSFVSAVKNFKLGAAKNTSGDYNKYPIRRANQKRSILKQFYPLLKW